jgi:hypothetical protein
MHVYVCVHPSTRTVETVRVATHANMHMHMYAHMYALMHGHAWACMGKKIKKLQHQLNDQKKKYATLRTKLNASGGTAADASTNSPPKKPRLGPKDCLNCNTSGDHHTKDCPVDRCAFCQKESCGHKFWECKARLAARKKRFNQSDK